MLSRLVITSHPRSKHLLISWLQSPSAVILEPQKIKSVTVSTISPSICHEMMGLDWTEICDIVQETGVKTTPKGKKNAKKKEALQIAVKREKRKAKEKRKDIPI